MMPLPYAAGVDRDDGMQEDGVGASGHGSPGAGDDGAMDERHEKAGVSAPSEPTWTHSPAPGKNSSRIGGTRWAPLTRICLARNQIGDDGAVALAQALQGNTKIEVGGFDWISPCVT